MNFSLRYWVARLGDHMSRGQLRALDGVPRYMQLGFLMREMGYRIGSIDPLVNSREDLFDVAGREVGDRKALYLEFGVFQGKSMRHWSKILTNPNSSLHGFDSFEGLPDAWNLDYQRGHFSTDGAIPVIDDPRVRFFKGWFDQSLAAYEMPEHEVLVVNFDADLYSSTMDILKRIGPHIVPGTYLFFDEFNEPQHELRAFMEFSAASRKKFVVRGATKWLANVLFQCVG